MPNPKHDTISQETISSLDDLIVTYDMKKLLAEAKIEFESIVSSRELLGQQAIASFFNLDVHEDERN